jgi:hypothetical protein
MNQCLNAIRRKVCHQRVTVSSARDEEMPSRFGILRVTTGKSKIRNIKELRQITVCDPAPSRVPDVEMQQLRAEPGGLHFIQSTVPAGNTVDVFLGRAIVAKKSHSISYVFVARSDRPSIPKGAEILGWIEAEGGGVPECTGAYPAVSCAVRLGCVLYQYQSMSFGELAQSRHLSWATEEVHRDDCPSAMAKRSV